MVRGGDSGLTLVEILIVTAIIAVLAAIAIPNMLASRLAANETAAIATLRTLVTAQAQIQGSGKIDADKDSIGEYGTITEMMGLSGVRTRNGSGADFNTQGYTVDPAILSDSMAENLQNSGYLVKSGYAFMVFLPDTADPARFTRERVRTVAVGKGKKKVTVELIALTGGTARVGIDLSESVWCAYAQPVTLGRSGRRAFFANQQGDILQSVNEVARHQGFAAAISGRSAFQGTGITSETAVGTLGMDGDRWKVTN
jgi:prepilin-type N-terminal cleavage/methylation domain-containing protein